MSALRYFACNGCMRLLLIRDLFPRRCPRCGSTDLWDVTDCMRGVP